MCSVSYIFIIIIGIKIVNWPKAMGHQALGVMGSIDIRCLREGKIGEGGGWGGVRIINITSSSSKQADHIHPDLRIFLDPFSADPWHALVESDLRLI